MQQSPMRDEDTTTLSPRRPKKRRRGWKITLSVLAVLVAGGVIGYPYAKSYVSDKMMDKLADEIITPAEIEEMKNDPEIAKILEENVPALRDELAGSVSSGGSGTGTGGEQSSGTGAGQWTGSEDGEGSGSDAGQGSGTGSSSADSPVSTTPVMSREEAMDLMMDKFSKSELLDLVSKAKGGITAEEKAEMQELLLSRVSEEEMEALKIAALIEIAGRGE
ncbi:hypothetical protein FHS18_000564 [Paenibacillus phyllosphaerae]|uniref:Uncharacterized protein n=1 Tax=Paenibacillus phyllosphaerae TaxID=274593 RepID=A0A7W5FKW2_9BACL|nr:hypothetical protein [Paenibacillus phyllosphaerae]MBB3108536.1 hypothetical protein [Paenibacillus phyllosphaerae]